MKAAKILQRARIAYNRARGFVRAGSVRLPLYRTIVAGRVEVVLARGGYERREVAAARKLLREGDVVLELGGGLGYVSTYLRKRTSVGPIITYEANADLIPYIVHCINQAKEIEVRHGVVISKPFGAALPFYVRADIRESSLCESDGAVARITEVPTVSWYAVLDELMPSAQSSILKGETLICWKPTLLAPFSG